MAPCRLLILLLFLTGLMVPECPALQIPGLSSSQTQASPQVALADPLGRDNPRGCILGFIKAAQEDNYSLAIQYFEPLKTRRRPPRSDEEELAVQLLAIFNHKFSGSLDFVSRDPQGRLDDGLPPEQEKVNSASWAGEGFSILLIRVEDEKGTKLWYFSRSTLDRVPKVYDSLTFPETEKHIPDYLVEHRLLSMPYWQWIAILLFVALALITARILTKALELLIRYSRKTRHLPPLPKAPLKRIGPLTVVFALLIHITLVASIGSSSSVVRSPQSSSGQVATPENNRLSRSHLDSAVELSCLKLSGHCAHRIAHKECEWKDGDRGGLAEWKQTERKKKKKEERKVCLDINRPSHGRTWVHILGSDTGGAF